VYYFVVQLIRPYTLICLALGAAAVWLLVRRWWPGGSGAGDRRPGRAAVALAILALLLFVLSLPPVGMLAARLVEHGQLACDELPEETDAIVALSRGITVRDEQGSRYELCSVTKQTCLVAARLYKQGGRRVKIVVCGGKVDPGRSGPTLAAAMEELLLALDVAPGDILVEDRSRTTYENARFARQLLGDVRAPRIVLISDAMHLPRARRYFEKQGFRVETAASTFRSSGTGSIADTVLPDLGSLGTVEAVAHELLGWLYDKLRGRL
jgi:uncharacterized SAM-binding protein YcdF (DUF218 family)